jgi:subtilase family serine protease
VGVGKNGTVYFGSVGSDGRPAVAVSRDHGASWSNQQPVGTEYQINNAVFPTMVAGDDDRAAFAFIGTPTDGNYQDTANFQGVWHLYVSTTYDGGKTWQTSDATPTDPVQRGSICTGGTTCGNDRNLLDFIDVTIDKQGQVEVGYADGCTGACVTDPTTNNHDAYATIARQTSGKPLFAAFDPKPNLTVPAMTVTRSGDSLVAKVTIGNTGRASAANIRTAVLDNGTQVGVATGSALAPGATKTLTVSWKTKKGSHTVTGSVDPLDVIAESNEGDNKRTVVANR